MTDDKPNVSNADPDDWRTFARERRIELATRIGEQQARRLLESVGPPTGLSAAQEIRLRVFEVFKRTSGSDKTRDDWAAWIEHGVDVPEGWTVEEAKRGYQIRESSDPAPDAGDATEAP